MYVCMYMYLSTYLQDGQVDGVPDGEGALLGVAPQEGDVVLAGRQRLLVRGMCMW